MRIDIITLFPEMFAPVLGESIIGRAQKSGAVEIYTHQLRDFAFDKHRRVDDTPYGGGMGMLMMAEPIALCFEAICRETAPDRILSICRRRAACCVKAACARWQRSTKTFVCSAVIMRVLTKG